MIDLIEQQLLEPLRIGLIIGLVITMFRTRAVTGQALPLALGVLFVAVLLPSTSPKPGVAMTDAMLAGLVSNLILLAIVMGLALAYQRLRR